MHSIAPVVNKDAVRELSPQVLSVCLCFLCDLIIGRLGPGQVSFEFITPSLSMFPLLLPLLLCKLLLVFTRCLVFFLVGLGKPCGLFFIVCCLLFSVNTMTSDIV